MYFLTQQTKKKHIYRKTNSIITSISLLYFYSLTYFLFGRILALIIDFSVCWACNQLYWLGGFTMQSNHTPTTRNLIISEPQRRLLIHCYHRISYTSGYCWWYDFKISTKSYENTLTSVSNVLRYHIVCWQYNHNLVDPGMFFLFCTLMFTVMCVLRCCQ